LIIKGGRALAQLCLERHWQPAFQICMIHVSQGSCSQTFGGKSSRLGFPKSSPNDGTAAVWGAHAPSRVVVGASADHILPSSLLTMGRTEAVGEGADCHTRGRVCSPELRKRTLGED
jgi:hypothetical protein